MGELHVFFKKHLFQIKRIHRFVHKTIYLNDNNDENNILEAHTNDICVAWFCSCWAQKLFWRHCGSHSCQLFCLETMCLCFLNSGWNQQSNAYDCFIILKNTAYKCKTGANLLFSNNKTIFEKHFFYMRPYLASSDKCNEIKWNK